MYWSILGFCVFFIFIDDKYLSIVYNWLLSGLTYLIANCGFNVYARSNVINWDYDYSTNAKYIL